MPESVTDRTTRSHEQVFLLAKSRRYYYDADAVAETAVNGDPAAPRAPRGAATPNAGRRDKQGESGLRRYDGFNARWSERVEPITRRNRRSVWTIPTQPYKDAHFATFPEALVEPCILAGSAVRACEVCGAPWERVSERGMPSEGSERPQARRAAQLWRERGLTDEHFAAIRAVGGTDAGKAQITMTGYGKNRPEVQRLADEAKEALGGYYREFLFGGSSTTGFRPTCACAGNTGAARSIVLDPFAGSGTTMRVAERLGRDSIGIELNPAYIDLQARRTDGVQVEMADLY